MSRRASATKWWDNVLLDCRFALRHFYKSPGFTAVAVLTIALGIGANTAIFSVFDAVLLRSLPVRDPSRLVLFSDTISEGTYTGDPPSSRWEDFSTEVADFLKKQPLPFESLAAFRSGEDNVTVRLGDSPVSGPLERASAHLVSGNYFSTLGVNVLLGRSLDPRDDQPNAAPVAVASYGYWQQHLHGDPSAVGKQVYLNGSAFTIVGITPPEFFGERVRKSPDFWMPLVFQPQIQLLPSYLERSDAYWLHLIGRLAPGATREQAQTANTAALQQFLSDRQGAKQTDSGKRDISRSHVELVDGSGGISWLRFQYSRPLHILLGVVALVLLIVCANVGNLLLSRAAVRKTEISVRLALGGSRLRIISQLLTESILLSIFGAACGLLLAHWGANVLFAMVAGNSPLNPHLSLPVLGFTILLTVSAGILFGLAPALSAGRTDLLTSLRAGRGSATSGHRKLSATHSLIVAQIAISLVLLVGANLLARSLFNLENQKLGFEQNRVLLVGIGPRMANYKPENAADLYRRLYMRLKSLPGVNDATVARYSPMSGHFSTNGFSIVGYAEKPGEDMHVETILVGPSYPETMEMALLQGREISLQDDSPTAKVAMVNEAFVRTYFPGQNPLGHRFDVHKSKNTGEYEIVGVLRDAQFHDVKEKVKPTIFPALLQDTTQDALSAGVIVRTAADPSSMASTVRQTIAELDPNLPVTATSTLSRQIASTFDVARVAAELVSFFGGLALLLAGIGLYGVVAQDVSRRTSEIGIRMALGARARDILRMVFHNTLALLGLGLLIGIPASLAANRLMKSQLFGVGAADAISFAIAAFILASVAISAGLLPARRASRVDPMVALRYE